MIETELSVGTRLSCQRALLGIITPNLRMVTLGWDGLNLLQLRAYFNVPPTEDEIEDIEAVCGEIVSDIPYEKDKVECIHNTNSLQELEVLKCIVYCRKE